MTPSLTEEQTFIALRAFLLAVLPEGMEVVAGQDNRVPMPKAGDFVVMTAAHRVQLAQTTHDYIPPVDPIPAIGSADIARQTALHFQLDIYGPSSPDNAQVITTLLRDGYGFRFLKPYALAPLYCEDAQQMPLVSGEKQYVQRWMVRCVLQGNLAVTVPQEFAETLITTLTEVD